VRLGPMVGRIIRFGRCSASSAGSLGRSVSITKFQQLIMLY